MALWDEVATRYSNEHLTGLTNPDNRTATDVDQSRADAAVQDAQADFLTHMQEEWDESIPQHVVPAVAGVIAYLYKRGGAASGIAKISVEDYRDELDRLAKARKKRRLLPKTISVLEPTDESEDADQMPDFDRSRFDDIVPYKKGESNYYADLGMDPPP